MKKLCCDSSLEACNEVQTRLAALGIACQIRSEDPGSLFAVANVPAPACLHEVWVVNDADFDRAVRALDETAAGEPEAESE